MTQELLKIEKLHAWYGESHILHGVNLTVNQGEVVTLLGRNGAGRTTTMRAIMSLTGTRKGSIKISGEESIKMVRPVETFLISCVTRSTSSWPMPAVGSSSSISSGSSASVVANSSARLRP